MAYDAKANIEKYRQLCSSYIKAVENLGILGQTDAEHKKMYDAIMNGKKGIQNIPDLLGMIHTLKLLKLSAQEMANKFCGKYSNGAYAISANQLVDYIDYTYAISYAFDIVGRQIVRDISDQTTSVDDPLRQSLQKLYKKAQYMSSVYSLMANIASIAKAKRMISIEAAELQALPYRNFIELEQKCKEKLAEATPEGETESGKI